ncbi:MAG: 23S rRNA (uracil(1939)-C(5))-methyltransferase RlmD [Planctomycetes bacterium]|nr:23S rRNA (uracil(1939)-C(5))-methyltransferase RlmD [Planctomycetota bacterium]
MSEQPVKSPPTRKPRAGDQFELDIVAFDGRGRGTAQRDGYHFTVRRAAPGATVRAMVLRRRGANIEAVALEKLAAGPKAVEPVCAHFGACGGCSLQDLAYSEQLAGLRALVERSFTSRLSTPFELHDVIPAPATTRYRNKMEFTFSARRWIAPGEPENAPNGFALGMHAAGVHGKVVDIYGCSIQARVADEILATVRELSVARALPPWDPKLHTGLLRYLVIRHAGSSSEVLVNLVTSDEAPDVIDPFVREIVARHPTITTFLQNVNSRPADTAIGDPGRERVLFGGGVIRERILGLEFELSAGSFFQTNSVQAERLFEIVREECALTGGETVYDLYCGTGTIALILSAAAREVIGFEIVSSSVADARANALRNGIGNVRFVEGDALDGLATEGLPAPDVVVVDPPRAGLHKKVLPRLAALGARRIVYVSCHHPAAAEDARVLESLGWRVERVRPIDMFPHTPHVECVITLVPQSAS